MARKLTLISIGLLAAWLSICAAAEAGCQAPARTTVANANRAGVVWTHHGPTDADGVDRITWWGCSKAHGRTVQFRSGRSPFAMYGPGEFLLGGSIADRRHVRYIGRWYAKLYDWVIIEGCSVDRTEPAVYRASLITGKVKLLQEGYTCDGEEFS